MKSTLNALALLVFLAALAWLAGNLASTPQQVSLSLGTLTLHTTVPVAAIALLMLLILTFYTGRLTAWLLRLPKLWDKSRLQRTNAKLIAAYTAHFLGEEKEAAAALAKTKPETPNQQQLATLLGLSHNLQTATLPSRLEEHLINPATAALAAWAAARHAAQGANWPEVARLTAVGREHAPQHLPLLTLQFKALANTESPDAATLLPALKPHLGPTRTKLVSQILSGPNALTARPLLENRWVKTFSEWLQTPSESFPDEPKGS